MPTKREREYYQMGFRDGFNVAQGGSPVGVASYQIPELLDPLRGGTVRRVVSSDKPKRKLSAWQKYIKNKRNHIKYRDGKLNLKKMGVEFRRKKRR
jgi:hypothetical protein